MCACVEAVLSDASAAGGSADCEFGTSAGPALAPAPATFVCNATHFSGAAADEHKAAEAAAAAEAAVVRGLPEAPAATGASAPEATILAAPAATHDLASVATKRRVSEPDEPLPVRKAHCSAGAARSMSGSLGLPQLPGHLQSDDEAMLQSLLAPTPSLPSSLSLPEFDSSLQHELSSDIDQLLQLDDCGFNQMVPSDGLEDVAALRANGLHASVAAAALAGAEVAPADVHMVAQAHARAGAQAAPTDAHTATPAATHMCVDANAQTAAPGVMAMTACKFPVIAVSRSSRADWGHGSKAYNILHSAEHFDAAIGRAHARKSMPHYLGLFLTEAQRQQIQECLDFKQQKAAAAREERARVAQVAADELLRKELDAQHATDPDDQLMAAHASWPPHQAPL